VKVAIDVVVVVNTVEKCEKINLLVCESYN
jgi:hypothetical protein